MKKVLLLLYEQSHFTELIRVGRLLKQAGSMEPVFLFSRLLVLSERIARICLDEGIICLGPDGCPVDMVSIIKREKSISPPVRITRRPSYGILKTIENKLKIWTELHRTNFISGLLRSINNSFSELGLLAAEIRTIKKSYKWMRKFLVEQEVSIIIMAEDNTYFNTAVWIKAGHKQKVPSLVVPYTISNPIEQAESALYDILLKIDTFPKKMVKLFFPRWVYTHKQIPLLRLPWYSIVAREWFRIAPSNPWMLNSGYADAIAVESIAMQKYYLKGKLSPQVLHLTGTIVDDVLNESLAHKEKYRKKLNEEMDLDPKKPILLVSLIPNGFPHPCEFMNYQELASFFGLLTTRYKNWNVIISPHPKQNKSELEAIPALRGKMTWIDSAHLVPLSSIYVASISATIRWAIACGIPVINYDMYQFNYDDYRQIPGVLHADNQHAFLNLLDKLTADKNFYNKTALSQQKIMQEWGFLDGLSSQRLLDLINSLISPERIVL
jgi:hypothetical protein